LAAAAAGLLALAATMAPILAGGPAAANPIPQDALQNDFKNCTSACAADQIPQEACKSACNCSIKAESESLSQEEYQAGTAAMNAGQPPPKDIIDKLTAISQKCQPQ
jgi:hypothetical protein